MYQMDKCNNNINGFYNGLNNGNGNSGLKEILSTVMKKERLSIDGVNFYDTLHSSGKHFVLDYRTSVFLSMSRQNYSRKLLEISSQSNQFKVYKIRSVLVLVIRKSMFKAQGFFSDLLNTLRSVTKSASFVSQTFKNGDAWLLLIDLVTMLLNIRDGYLTPTKVLTTMLTMFTMYKRLSKNFSPQFLGDTYETLSVFLSLIGVPDICKTTLTTYASLTGKRLFTSNFIFSLISALYNTFKCFFNWLGSTNFIPVSLIETTTTYMDLIFGNILCYDKIKKVVDVYTKYVTNPEVILRPEFRHEVTTLHDSVKNDVMFNDYVTNHDNKYFKDVWLLFNNNLVKYVSTFASSSKEEPICFVFEGEPGSGKSVLMNSFVEVLKKMNKSIYVHSVPPSEGGKDFYDDYENQEVFVMDDVGQQGKSQWRTIINFVSPVKYPLECANASKKNTKFFSSKIILCTTNQFTGLSSFTSKDCIAEPEALFRRAHVIKVKRLPGEGFSQQLSYYKFDHIASKRWENSFLHHNANVDLKPNVVVNDLKDSLKYVRMLLNRIKDNEDNNRKVTNLNDQDLTYILQDTDDFDAYFDAQSGFDIFSQGLQDFLFGLKGMWSEYYNGFVIFGEWFASLLVPCKEFIKLFTRYILSFITGNSDNPLMNILRSKTPSDILGSREERYHNFRRLALKFHPDKYVDNPEFTREEGAYVYILINLAYRHYDQPLEFNKQRAFAFRNKENVNRIFDENPELQFRDFIVDKLVYAKLYLYHMFSSFSWDEIIIVSFYTLYVCALIYFVMTAQNETVNVQENLKDRVIRQSQKLDLEFRPQSIVDVTVRKFVKYVLITSDDHSDFYTHGIVSGNRLLINSHAVFKNPVVTVFSSYDHFLNNHAEVERNDIKLISNFPSCDLAVFEFTYLHSLYPTCKPLFRSREITPHLFLCTSFMEIPLIFNKNVFKNDSIVEYAQYGSKTTFTHPKDSGLITPIEGDGLCGSFVCNSHGDIIAVHSAGDGTRGFCAIPSEIIGNDINNLMCSVRNMQLDIDVKIRPNFSGTRLVYGKDVIETQFPSFKSSIVPSILHVDSCKEMAELIQQCNTEILSDDFVHSEIDRRGPPVIDKPVKTIKETSLKTFQNQGTVTTAELNFIKDCIRSLMPKDTFDDLDDYTTAFGDEIFSSLNKESSNGYGHPVGKDKYFDFENKVIRSEFFDEFNAFIDRIKLGEYEYKDFLSKECFKVDELRNESKRCKPRTIRVLPVTHIWLTKKIFGKLAQYISEHKHDNGIGLGFNPFKDFDILYKKLTDPNIGVTGDLDAAKWDGSLVARIMIAIMEVMFEKYDGKFKFAKDFLITSIVRSFVIVADELFATTHGLPSGVWITFLLNSFFNRGLDALVVFRNVPNPTVRHFLSIVSYVTGDDKIFGVPKGLSEYVNLISYRDVSESLGMTATNGDKSSITKTSQPVEKLTYLKRHMRFHPVLKRYVGPLSMNTILNMAQWCDATKDTYEAMSGKIRASQIEAYLHSPSFFYHLTKVYETAVGSQYSFF